MSSRYDRIEPRIDAHPHASALDRWGRRQELNRGERRPVMSERTRLFRLKDPYDLPAGTIPNFV